MSSKYYIFSDSTDMNNLTRISFEDTKDYVEETNIREVFKLDKEVDIFKNDRDFTKEWVEQGYGFLETPYFFQNNEELFEGTSNEDFQDFFDVSDGEIIIDSKHPNFKKILDTIPNESDYYYGTFDPISKTLFEEKIEVNFQNGFKLMIIELDID